MKSSLEAELSVRRSFLADKDLALGFMGEAGRAFRHRLHAEGNSTRFVVDTAETLDRLKAKAVERSATIG
jgi:hypothetical protein